MKHAFKWGLWDIKDRFWYGGEKGPNTYDDYKMAQGAATILSGMFDYRRIRPRIIPPEVLHDRGTVDAKYTAEQVLKRMGV
jgi:hypothetical protein